MCRGISGLKTDPLFWCYQHQWQELTEASASRKNVVTAFSFLIFFASYRFTGGLPRRKPLKPLQGGFKSFKGFKGFEGEAEGGL